MNLNFFSLLGTVRLGYCNSQVKEYLSSDSRVAAPAGDYSIRRRAYERRPLYPSIAKRKNLNAGYMIVPSKVHESVRSVFVNYET